MTILPTGAFTCEIVLRRIRAPHLVREEREGVTYLVARDYEIAYDTILRFADDVRLPVRARRRRRAESAPWSSATRPAGLCAMSAMRRAALR